MSLVAVTPVGSGQPDSSAGSTPTLSCPCADTPTNSISGRPMMACSDRRPMFPVVHWITRSGWSALVALIWGSFADVIELIIFNRLTAAGAGQLLRRVNFGDPDNFPA